MRPGVMLVAPWLSDGGIERVLGAKALWQLADCIHAVLSDTTLREQLIAQGRARNEDFDKDRVLPLLEDCYRPR
jgi:hypothetical protein